MVIHTVGDSHSYNGWDALPNIITHHLGPRLCFSIGRDGIDLRKFYDDNDIVNLNNGIVDSRKLNDILGLGKVNEGDTVVFCFGEIDCRCHIHKYVSEDRNYKDIINNIVDKYFIQIKKAVDTFTSLQTAVYNVVPPVKKEYIVENEEYPQLGTDEERKQYVVYFNEKLKHNCIEYGYIFVDVYDKYTDEDGFLNKLLSDGTVHIRDASHIKSFIDANFISS